jgi:hypothetical protein
MTREHREIAVLYFVGTDNIDLPEHERLRQWIESDRVWGVSSKFASLAQLLAERETIAAERERAIHNLGMFEIWRALGQPEGEISATTLAAKAAEIRADRDGVRKAFVERVQAVTKLCEERKELRDTVEELRAKAEELRSASEQSRSAAGEKAAQRLACDLIMESHASALLRVERDELRAAAEENSDRWTELMSELCCADEQLRGHRFLAAGWRRLVKSWRESWRNAMTGLSTMGHEKTTLHAEAERMLTFHLEETLHLAEQRNAVRIAGNALAKAADALLRAEGAAVEKAVEGVERELLAWTKLRLAPDTGAECTCGRGACAFHRIEEKAGRKR